MNQRTLITLTEMDSNAIEPNLVGKLYLRIKNKLVSPINLSFSEINEIPNFNWNKALNLMIKLRDNFSCLGGKEDQEYYRLSRLLEIRSQAWVTCACGNACSMIPRYPNGAPIDKILKEYGVQFNILISQGLWRDAKDLLISIENKSNSLIEETLIRQKHDLR